MTSSFRKTAFVLLALAFFFFGSVMLPRLNYLRDAHDLIYAPAGKHAPPEIVLATTALGGFRGIILNAVAYRAWELKVQGKFWELVQLYEWISELQPHAEKVWTDLAWNMSYNIVAELKTPEDRFKWVWRSIEYLRDKGLEWNPRSFEIARELSWILQQKIGRETDEFHIKYMWYLSTMIDTSWGSGFPDLKAIVEQAKATGQDDESRVKNADQWELAKKFNVKATAWNLRKNPWNADVAWDALIKSDEDVAQLVKRFDKAGISIRDTYGTIQALLEDGPEDVIKDVGVLDPEEVLKDERVRAWLAFCFRNSTERTGPLKRFFEDGMVNTNRSYYNAAAAIRRAIPDEVKKAFLSPDFWKARRKIELYIIERRLRMQFKMDPERMLELEDEYAPMDWRLPEPHSMYWAKVALENRLDPISGKPDDTIDARRLLFFCSQQLYRRGTILFRSNAQVGRMMFGFNLDFLSKAENTFTELVDYYKLHPDERAAMNIGDAEKQFLEEAVRIMSWSGQNTKAEELYAKLQRRYPSDNRKDMPLDDWVTGQVRKMVQEWGRQTQVQTLAASMLLRGYAHLIVGQTDLAAAYHEQCKQVWGWYREDEIMRQTDKRTESIPTFDELKKLVVDSILRGDYGEMFSPDSIATLRELLGVEPAEGEAGGAPVYKLPETWLRHGMKEGRKETETPETSRISAKD